MKLLAKQPATPEQLAAEMAQDMQLAATIAEPIIEAAAGYRAKCADAGFTPAAAEQMATDYHGGLLRLMLR